MTCTFCGSASPAGSTYCDRCGQRLAPAAGTPAPAPPAVGGIGPAPAAPASEPTPPPAPDMRAQHASVAPATPDGQDGPRRWWVAALAAAVVLAAGVGVGLSLGGEDDGSAADASQGSSPDATTSSGPDELDGSNEAPDAAGDGSVDDLGLGYPQVDQGCTGEYVVILASTGDPASYRSTLAPALGRSATGQYLVTNQSCSSFNQEVDGNPIYAAYDGPYASLEEACASRATSSYPDAYVRRLDGAAQGRSYCSCIDEASSLPVLNRGNAEEGDLATRYVVTDVQSILYRVGLNPDQLVGGSFGPATTGWLKTFQRNSGLAPTGSTDYDTWSALQDAGCEDLQG